MKMFTKSLFSVVLLFSAMPCVVAESTGKADQVQVQEKETEQQKLGRELLEFLQGMIKKYVNANSI